MDSMERPGGEVGRAAAAVDRAMAGLVKLLRSGDDSVRREALDELLKIGPFALGHMIGLLFDTRDRALRLRIIGALPAFAPTASEPVLLALAGVLQGETDPDARRAAVAATFATGPRPGPPPTESPDPTRPSTEATDGQSAPESRRPRAGGTGPTEPAGPPTRSPVPSPPGRRDPDDPRSDAEPN